MADKIAAVRRYFSLDEAHRALPQVELLMRRALQLHGLLESRVAQLTAAGGRITPAVLAGRDEVEGNVDPARLAEASALYQAIVDQVKLIEGLGAEVKGVHLGLVDFWSWLDGEHEVLLCWKLGERQIEWFHSPDEGFAGRRRVESHHFSAERRRPTKQRT